MLKNICIIGAGNIGSRHLQALAKIIQPLSIQVIDPSPDSLKLAKEKYHEIKPANPQHQLNYLSRIEDVISPIDIAIIATTSNIRSAVTKQLLDISSVRYIIFEKILFDNPTQYQEMEDLLANKRIKAWVNCPRRVVPFYKNLKDKINKQKIQYLVSGSQWGLACNVIHLVDHIAFLTDCYDFEVDTKNLNPVIIQSKRKGFLELTGTLTVKFKEGSFGILTSHPTGNIPMLMQIITEKFRFLALEMESQFLIANAELKSEWSWKTKAEPLPYQSKITTNIVDSLIKTGSCNLVPLNQSSKLHLQLFEPLLKFVNNHSSKKYEYYPFT